jgi:hypothetical protein
MDTEKIYALEIKETHVNESKGYCFSETEWHTPFTTDIGHLYRSLQGEYGRCISYVYNTVNGATVPIGWVFQKRLQYEDSPEFYIRESWVMIRLASDSGFVPTKDDHPPFWRNTARTVEAVYFDVRHWKRLFDRITVESD